MTRRHAIVVHRIAAIGAALVVAGLAAGACGSGPSGTGDAGRVSTAAAAATTTATTSAPAGGGSPSSPVTATVTDASGAGFDVAAQTVVSPPTVSVDGQVRFAPPGETYLVDTLDVSAHPGTSPGALSDFDDRDTGLAPDVEFALPAAEATAHGYGATCGVEAGYASSVCPVTLGQGLTVDSHSVTGPSGAGAQIVVSYGPVPLSFPVASVSVWFHAAPLPPQKLTG